MQDKVSFPWLGLIVVLFFVVAAAGFLLTKGLLNGPENAAESRPLEMEPAPLAAPIEPVLSERDETLTDTSAGDVMPEESEPLPALHQSDSALKQKLGELSGGSALIALLVNDELIRKSVRAVHGLNRGFVVKEFRPVQSPEGRFIVVPTGQQNEQGAPYFTISSENADRYARYIDVLTRFEPEQAFSAYQHFYPLLQQAYEELGLSNPSFDTVMLKAIDRMLEPTQGRFDEVLSLPSVMYVFNDKKIESSSGVNKLKLRIGTESWAEVEQWLTAFRKMLLKRVP